MEKVQQASTISLQIGENDKKIELSLEEARELQQKLDDLLGDVTVTFSSPDGELRLTDKDLPKCYSRMIHPSMD